jgi:hypothetical protein
LGASPQTPGKNERFQVVASSAHVTRSFLWTLEV